MNDPAFKAEGGCLCGAIRYEITAPPRWQGYCHCSMCRKAGGAPYVAWIAVPTTGFRIIKGEPKIYVSSPRATRRFCAKCGSQLVFQYNDKPDYVDVTVASLDDPSWFHPQEHVNWDDHLPFVIMDDGLKRRPPKK